MATSHYLPPGIELGYSTNVHPGETLRSIRRSLSEYTVPIKTRVFGDEPAGLELRLGIGAARELRSPEARHRFREFLDASGLVLFSVNAFPLADFHARRVKENVYLPSWASRERARWTTAIARIADELAPPGTALSVSTLGGGFRAHGHTPSVFRKMAARFVDALGVLRDVERRTGRSFTLAVEPEPDTTFETAGDVIGFFENYLLPAAWSRWRGSATRSRIEDGLRKLFSVNVDTCHLSVLFENPVGSLRALRRAGLQVGKLHVTNAVRLSNPYRARAGYGDLRAMDEPRYLHQFAGKDARGRVVWRGLDLSELPAQLDRGSHPAVEEMRSHFHVPLYLKRFRRLQTTRDETESAVREVLRRRLTGHLVIETYTWPILAGREDRRRQLVDGIAREFRWLLAILRDVRRTA